VNIEKRSGRSPVEKSSGGEPAPELTPRVA